MQLVELGHVGGQQDVLEVTQVPLGVDQLGEGVGQVKLLQIVKVCQDSGRYVKN